MIKSNFFFNDIDFVLILFFLFLIFLILFLTQKISKINFKIKKYIKNEELKSEIYRKVPHISIGIIFTISLTIFSKTEMMIFSMLVFGATIVNIFLNQFPVINRVKRVSFGIFMFPLSIIIMTFLFYEHKEAFLFGLWVLVFSDSLASIFGKAFGEKKFFSNVSFLDRNISKTYVGSFVFFIITIIIYLIIKYLYDDLIININEIIKILIISFLLMIMEIFFIFGLDNFVLPIVASYLFLII